MALRWSRRQAMVAVVATVLIAVGSISMIGRHFGGSTCGAEKVDSPVSPLQSAETLKQRPSKDRDRTVAAVTAMGPPFGPVVAGTDYYYDQWLHLYGVPGGVLAWTKDNAPVTYLDDETLTPRWSLRPTAKRTAWDVSADAFLLLDLADGDPVTVGRFDLRSGEPDWCVEIATEHRAGEPVSTTFLENGDVVTALPSGAEILLLRLAGDHGDQRWGRKIATADRADYLGMLTDRLLLVGGIEESRLTDPAADNPADSSVTAVDIEDGSTSWTWSAGPDSALHVVGTAGGQAVVLVRRGGATELVALSDAGQPRWRTRLPAGSREATLRGAVVVVRSDAGLEGYDVAAGKVSWRRAIPTDRPYIPLGFTLGQMPSVDAEHLLMPTVSSLELLSTVDGSSTSFPMPVDGLSSAYFAYQLLATEKHLGVVTNTGAVIAARE